MKGVEIAEVEVNGVMDVEDLLKAEESIKDMVPVAEGVTEDRNVAEAGVEVTEVASLCMAAQSPGGTDEGRAVMDPVFIFMIRYMATMNCSVFKTPIPEVSTRFLVGE